MARTLTPTRQQRLYIRRVHSGGVLTHRQASTLVNNGYAVAIGSVGSGYALTGDALAWLATAEKPGPKPVHSNEMHITISASGQKTSFQVPFTCVDQPEATQTLLGSFRKAILTLCNKPTLAKESWAREHLPPADK